MHPVPAGLSENESDESMPQIQTNTPVIAGTGLNKEYKSPDRKVRALCDATFELHTGEILGIVGASGCGKSTLLRVISGIERPDSGRLYHEGGEYTGAGPRIAGQFLRVIFQNAYTSFDPRMTMERSLREGSDASRSELLHVLEKVGLREELLQRRPGKLSGGECQRMSIARALLSHAKVILCDEITSALDVTTQAQVVKLLTELRAGENLSIIFVSHDLALVSSICDRVMQMQDGRLYFSIFHK